MDEYKLLGVCMDTSGKYKVNMDKNEKRIPIVISTLKGIAKENTVGKNDDSSKIIPLREYSATYSDVWD